MPSVQMSVWMLLVVGCGRWRFDLEVDATSSGCPDQYEAIEGGCYRIVINPTVELSWPDAEAACEAEGSGAHLMVADDDEEIAVIVGRFGSANDAWIGLSDRVVENDFITVTGAPPYLPWDVGEPDANGDCVQLIFSGVIGDRDCAVTNDYVCEYDGQPPRASQF